MTLLLGFTIGLFLAAVIVGYRTQRRIALEQYEADIPAWVNQGNRAVIGTYDDILLALWEAAHIEQWETEMGDR